MTKQLSTLTGTQLAQLMRGNNITPLQTIVIDTLLDNYGLTNEPSVIEQEQFDAVYQRVLEICHYYYTNDKFLHYISPENITNALLDFMSDETLDFNQIMSLSCNTVIASADELQAQEA